MSRSVWNRRNRWVVGRGCLTAALLTTCVVCAADEPYPEARRFDSSEFYRGLKRRGLTDLLSLHLREHPPTDELEALLLARDIKMAEYADPSRGAKDRSAAISEANLLLESLIQRRTPDKKTRAWRIELGQSLLYVEGAPYTSRILYRGETARDRAALGPLMDRAIAVLSVEFDRMTKEYDGLDQMSAPMYDRMEAAGGIDRLEQDLAQVDYLLAWARFYRAVSREVGEPEREEELGWVLDYLTGRSNLLDTPHETTHYQAQALLLAGMVERRMGNHSNARRRLAAAIDAAHGVTDDEERASLRWAVTLARIELVRDLTTVRSFRSAKEAVEVFRRQAHRSDADEGDPLIVGLLARYVLRAEADDLEADGHRAQASALRETAVADLAELARSAPGERAAIYAALYELLRERPDIATLSGFERCAVVAGALGEADELSAKIDHRQTDGTAPDDADIVALEELRAAVLDHAIGVARSVMVPTYKISSALRAEAGFNLGVALYRRGRRLDAARAFQMVADGDPTFERALDAATFAVQLSWELQEDPGLGSRPEIQSLYLDALTTLTEKYAESSGANYWQFFLGQQLEHLERFDEAASAYAKVSPDHERYAESMYLAAESRGRALRRLADDDPGAVQTMGARVTVALSSARHAKEQLARALAAAHDDARRAELRHMAARAELLVGELCVIPGVNRFDRGLEAVGGFERRFPEASELIGRVLRVRMIALESLGRVEEASQLIPQYVLNDPAGAVATLQGLFDALTEEIEADQRAGRAIEARERAVSAVAIADGIYSVARERPGEFGRPAIYVLRLQLAEATLAAGDPARAASLFDECMAEDARRYPDGKPRDSRALFGSARAKYLMEDYGAALPLFHLVFRGAKRGEEVWWRSLLGDLQCRTELREDAKSIVKAINQHKYFDREMGGTKLRRQFDALLATNERRMD